MIKTKRTENSKTQNSKMNDHIYRLRREVIDLIYEARDVVSLPRITVRITENHETMLGCARMNDNILWITRRAISAYDLRAIVYHEIAHAVFGAEHNESCPLMKSIRGKDEKLSKEFCQKALRNIAK